MLQDAIRDYLLYLHHEQGASPATSRCYEYALRRFTDWLTTEGHPSPQVADVTTSVARRYLYFMNGQGLRPRTRLRLWAAIRSFYRMLVERGVLEVNPLEGIALPKKDPAHRLLVSDEELLAVLEAAGAERMAWRAARNQGVLAVLIFTGLRRTEVLDLRVQDVDLARSLLRVAHGKGNKARLVPLCSEVKEYLSKWLAVRPEAHHDYLWAYGQARRLHPNGLSALLEQAKTVAGYAGAENIKPHSIRHRAATRLLQNGADIRSVQAWLGHSHLSTTAIYLHCDEKRLQSIAHLASFTPHVGAPPLANTNPGSAPAAPPPQPAAQQPPLGPRFRRASRRGNTPGQSAGGAA